MSPLEVVPRDRAARRLSFLDATRARLAACALLLLAPAAARAEGVTPPADSATANAAGVSAAYQLAWGSLSESDARLGLSYDHALAPDRTLTFGARAGALVGPHRALPYVGARLMLWTPIGGAPALRLWGGLGADLWFDTRAAAGGPVFLYTGLDVGARVALGGPYFVEVPVQLGVLPIFDPLAYAFSAGVRFGRSF